MISLLSKREKDIMSILWTSEVPLKASDIVKSNSSLTMNTVQSVLTKLLKRGLINVEKIEYSGNVLARCFSPSITPDEYAIKQLDENLNKFGNSTRNTKLSKLISYFLDEADDQNAIIQELEALLKERKKQIK
jgi:Predicted transcriptional regulator